MLELKSKQEIDKMRTAGKLTAEILYTLAEAVKPGMSTYDIDVLAVKEMKKRNVETVFLNYKVGPHIFPANVCTSINEEIVHGIPNKNKILKEGDIIGIDIATRYDGFVGDTAVTVGVGNISKKLKRFLRLSEQCLWEGITKSVEGNHLGDIGHAIQSYLESHSLHVVRDFYGHGIGRQMHEAPNVPHFGEPKTGMKLQEGLVFTIEPMVCMESNQTITLDDGWTIISADKKPGAHFEHTLAITKDGPEILTKL